MGKLDLYHLLEEQVEGNRNKIAIINEREQMTYEEFFRLVKQLTNKIMQYHIKDEGILLVLPRNSYLLAAMFAVVKSGNYYIPIDLSYPDSRVDYISKHSGAIYVITDQIHKENYLDKNVILVDNHSEAMLDMNDSDSEDTIAYCLYTSGSTGNPKGVLIGQNALINFIDGMQKAIDFTEVKTILCITTQCFDIFFLESVFALCTGLCVVLADDMTVKNPKSILKLIHEYDVDVMQITPSRMQLLMKYEQELESLHNIKLLLIGGEGLSNNLLQSLRRTIKAKIYNMYGPTETTIWSLVGDMTQKTDVTIGKPIVNTKVYIMDEKMQVLEDDSVGEICIAGLGLSKGYLNAPAQTNERFRILENGSVVYLTGDYGKKCKDNDEYVYVGRKDNQVKFNGYRIELEEIEQVTAKMDGITQNVVSLEQINSGNPQLVQYYVSDEAIAEKQISDFLKLYLPQYMIPNRFIRVKQFFYTLNGKIDRNKLPQVEFQVEQSIQVVDLVPKVVFETIYQAVGQIVSEQNQGTILDLMGSFDYVTVLVALEEYFKVEFSDSYLVRENNLSVNQLCKELCYLIEQKE